MPVRQRKTAVVDSEPFFLKEKTDYFIRFLQQQQTVCLAHRPLESVLEPWDAISLQSWSSNEQLNNFVAENMDNLAKDAAMGSGEYVDTLAELMDVPGSERVEFSQMLQENFSNIFTDGSVSHVEVIENISLLM